MEELEDDCEMSKDMLSFVRAQVGFLLLFDLHFEEAVNHFLQSETMQPSEVFPFIMRDPNRWSLLVYFFLMSMVVLFVHTIQDCSTSCYLIVLSINSAYEKRSEAQKWKIK